GGMISGGQIGVYVNGPGTVSNMAGATISGSGRAGAYFYYAGNVLNSGLIISSSGIGVDLILGGNVTNASGATISGQSSGIRVVTSAATITNAGTISAGTGNNAVSFAANAANRLIVDPGAVFTGNIAGGTGTMELSGAGSGTGSLGGFGTSITNFNSL